MPKLTEDFIASFQPAEGAKDRLVFDTVTTGLGVRAYRVVEETRDGTKKQVIARSFVVQWTDKATGRKMREKLGTWGGITLKQARDAAMARLGRVAQGINPAAERAAQKVADDTRRSAAAAAKEEARFTLDLLIADWARLHLAKKRPRYSAEAERALRLAFKAHLAKPASALNHAAVTAVLDALAGDGKAAMAGRTLSYGRACFGWAVKRRRLRENPFSGLEVEGSNPERDRVLADEEIGAIWRAAGTLRAPFNPLVKVLLLTAQRREEVAGMRWSEVSADLRTWTLPAVRAKNGKAHIVHLAEPVRAILAGITRIEGRDLIFSTTGTTPPSGFSKAKSSLDAAMAEEAALVAQSVEAENPKTPKKAKTPARRRPAEPEAKPEPPGWRFHDFRRSAVTWLAENGFPPHVADKLLNHVQGTIKGVAAIYQRGEFLAERRAALDAWAAHVLAQGEGVAVADNVFRPAFAAHRAAGA